MSLAFKNKYRDLLTGKKIRLKYTRYKIERSSLGGAKIFTKKISNPAAQAEHEKTVKYAKRVLYNKNFDFQTSDEKFDGLKIRNDNRKKNEYRTYILPVTGKIGSKKANKKSFLGTVRLSVFLWILIIANFATSLLSITAQSKASIYEKAANAITSVVPASVISIAALALLVLTVFIIYTHRKLWESKVVKLVEAAVMIIVLPKALERCSALISGGFDLFNTAYMIDCAKCLLCLVLCYMIIWNAVAYCSYWRRLTAQSKDIKMDKSERKLDAKEKRSAHRDSGIALVMLAILTVAVFIGLSVTKNADTINTINFVIYILSILINSITLRRSYKNVYGLADGVIETIPTIITESDEI